MKKEIIYLLLLFLIILLVKCYDYDYEMIHYDDEEEDDYDEDDGYESFRKTLREYLTENNLIDSDKLIKPKRLKRIFLETVGDTDVEGVPQKIKDIYDQMADFFIEKYYTKKKEIKGKDIFKLFNFNEISMKLNELIQANPYYGEEDDDKLKDDEDDPNFRDDYDL